MIGGAMSCGPNARNHYHGDRSRSQLQPGACVLVPSPLGSRRPFTPTAGATSCQWSGRTTSGIERSSFSRPSTVPTSGTVSGTAESSAREGQRSSRGASPSDRHPSNRLLHVFECRFAALAHDEGRRELVKGTWALAAPTPGPQRLHVSRSPSVLMSLDCSLANISAIVMSWYQFLEGSE